MDLNEITRDFQSLRVKRRHYIWEPFMKKYDCNYVCEVGVQIGENFIDFIQHNPKLAVAVDSWINDGTISRNDGGYTQEELETQYQAFRERVKDKDFVKICREYSFDAAKKFEDNFFDLIYIDADHTFDACYKDIVDWYPKVKPGKFLTGDDYRVYKAKRTRVRFGVIEAVNKFATENKLDIILLPKHGWAIVKPEQIN